MATVKRKKKTAKRPERAISSLVEVRKALAAGRDIVLVAGTSRRPEVRVRHDGLNRIDQIDRFAFLAYRTGFGLPRYHVFVDGEYIGIERGRFKAAMVGALTYASLFFVNPGGIKHRADAICDLLRFNNE